MQLRQSLKGVKLAYVLTIVLTAAMYWLRYAYKPDVQWWAPLIVTAVLLLLTMIRHIRRRTTQLAVVGERIRYEAGLFSKTTRIIELTKVQDVRVDQTLSQRMINVGDLSLETAGESSRIVMSSIDGPKEAAEKILELARGLRNAAGAGPASGPLS